MVDLSLTCFAIPREMAASFNTITTAIVVAGENACNPYHNGHGVHVFVELGFICPIVKKHFQFKGMTRDFACSLTIRFIQQASTRLLEVHHLKMASLLKSPKRHTLRALEVVLVCLLAPSCFERHVPRHHTADSYLRFWSLFPHWASLESYPSWHVIESTFTTALPREANLKVHFKESLESPRKTQALFFQSSMLGNGNVFPFPMLLPRETPLAFLREQTHFVSPHHLPTLTQNN
jgi:hypothetical protein